MRGLAHTTLKGVTGLAVAWSLLTAPAFAETETAEAKAAETKAAEAGATEAEAKEVKATDAAETTEETAAETQDAQPDDAPKAEGFDYMPQDLTEGLEPSKAADFDLLLVRPGTDFSSYDKVYLEPLEFALVNERAQIGVTSSDMAFLDRNFNRRLTSGLKGKAEIVDEVGPGVLVVALAIIDVEPNRDIIGSFPLQRTRSRVFNQQSVGIGSITVEGVFLDGESGEVIAVNKHNYRGPIIQANPNLFTRWGDARAGMRVYARKLAALLK